MRNRRLEKLFMHICLFLWQLNLHCSFFDISLWTLAFKTMPAFFLKAFWVKRKASISISLGFLALSDFHIVWSEWNNRKYKKFWLALLINKLGIQSLSQKSFRMKYFKDSIVFFKIFNEELPKKCFLRVGVRIKFCC